MSQQPWLKCQPKPCMYTQLLAVEGVTNVEMFDFSEEGCGVYVEGGSDEDIAEAMSLHTYGWNRNWFVGDTSVVKEFFTARFYRDYNVFLAKFKQLRDEK